MRSRYILAGSFVALAMPLFASAATNSCLVISRTLARGASGADVQLLQQYLVSQGMLSSDGATGYFGGLTEAALQKWQTVHGPVSSGTPSSTGFGTVGAKTRALLCSVTSGTPPLPPVPSASGPSSTPPPPPVSASAPLPVYAPTNNSGGPPPPPPASSVSSPASSSVSAASSTALPQGVGTPPNITSFIATSNDLLAGGQNVTLSWSVFSASNCTLVRGDTGATLASSAAQTSSAPVIPVVTTKYSLTCSGLGDGSTSTPATAAKSLTIVVEHPVPTCTVTINKTSYVIGDTVRLSWTSTDADSGLWTHTIGDVISMPYGPVDPSGQYFYTVSTVTPQIAQLTVKGVGGTATCSATIHATAPTVSSGGVLDQLASLAIAFEDFLSRFSH